MKATKIVNAGTLTAASEEISNATKVTLAASTKQFIIEMVMTNSTTPSGDNPVLGDLRWATSNVDATAATFAAAAMQNSVNLTLRAKLGRSEVSYFATKPFVPAGQYLYVWINHSKLPANATVDVWLYEDDSAVGFGGSALSSTNPLPVAGAGTAIKISPTVTAGAYAANDIIGGKLTLTDAVRQSGGTSRLENVIINDRSNQKPAGYILLFDSDPSAATTTNDGPLTLSTDDLKVIGRIDVSAADYVTLGSDSKAIADVPYSGRLLKASGSANLYAVFVTTGTPTFATTSAIQLTFNLSYLS